VTENVTLFGHVLTFMCFQLPHCVSNVGSRNDGVTLEYAPRFPTPDSLDDTFRNSRTPEIAGGGSPQIMEQKRWHASSLASLGPGVAEIFHLAAILPSEDVCGRSFANHACPQEGVNGVGHYDLAAFAILRCPRFQSNDALRKVELFSTKISQLAHRGLDSAKHTRASGGGRECS